MSATAPTLPQGRLLRRGLRVIRRQVALHPRPFVIAVSGAAIYAIGTVAQSWVLGQVVDRAVTPRFQSGQLRAGVAVAAAAAIVAVGLVKTVGIITRRIAATIVHANVQATLRDELAQRYHRLPLTWHHEHPAGELLSRAEGDLDAASEILSPLPFATGVLTMLGAAAVWLFLADPFLAALGLLVVPAILVLNLAFQRRVEQPTTLGQERLGDMSAVAHESFDGALVVKALQAEEAEGRRFADKAELLRDARIEAARVTANFEASLDALPALATVALLVIGVWRIEQGAITPGTLVGLINLFALLIWPLRLIGYVLGDMPRAVAGYERVSEVLAEPLPAGPAPAAGDGLPGGPLELVVDRVGYGYEPGAEVLHEVSFRVPAGSTVALVGPTGSGKSTLALLLARLLEPDRGTIRLGGRDLAELDPGELAAAVGVAFQEPFLFSTSVADNIRLERPHEDGVVDAARLAQAEEFVTRLPDGYDTVVGERGATLSGGQRQRVALARALAGRPRLLVLDDATSSVDPVTEAAILGGLEGHLPSTTTVVVASRLATIGMADRVLYLEEGRLVADGDHHRLLATTPGYARLVRAYEQAEQAAGSGRGGPGGPRGGPPVGQGRSPGGCPGEPGAVVRHGSEVGAQQIPALRLLRRGLAASPELRKGAALTLALALVAGGGRVITPVLVQQTIDRHIIGGSARLSGMLVLAGAGVALILVAAWAARTTNQRLATASERALCGLRVRAFNHIHALSMAHHTEEQRGALVSRVTSDVETLGQFFRWGGLAWIINSALMLAALIAMVVYDWRLALVAVATVLPLAAVLRVMQRRVVVAWDLVRTRVGESLAAISESIQGAAVIRAYGVQEQAQRRVMRSVEARRRAEVRAGTIGAFFFPSGELFGVVTTAAVLLVGMAIGPEGGLTIGTLVAFAFLVTIFLEPVAEFTEILDMTQQAVAGWKKVLDVLDTPVEVDDPRPGLTLPARALDIELDRVSFAYHGGPPVLTDVSVEIPAGTRVAMVGTTGSGKTTLAKLLIRLADPVSGSIRVAGTDLRQVSLASLRSALVMVPQDGFLFDTSVAGNVRMGRPEADDREVRSAFDALGLGGWVDALPRGVHTRVGERGEYLSVGERQLVALARGYLADPGCLILDEATSAVDPATEVALRNAIQRLTEGRTAITIAHRLATAEHADLVLVLERGRLVQQGTHARLLADPDGAYARLHSSWMASLAAGGETAGAW